MISIKILINCFKKEKNFLKANDFKLNIKLIKIL